MVGSTAFTLGATLQGSASALPMLLVGRALAGLGEGHWLSNVSVYSSTADTETGISMSGDISQTDTGSKYSLTEPQRVATNTV